MPHSVVSGGARSVAPSRCSNSSNKSRVEHKFSPGTESLVKRERARRRPFPNLGCFCRFWTPRGRPGVLTQSYGPGGGEEHRDDAQIRPERAAAADAFCEDERFAARSTPRTLFLPAGSLNLHFPRYKKLRKRTLDQTEKSYHPSFPPPLPPLFSLPGGKPAGEALPPKCSPISNRSPRRPDEKEEEDAEKGEPAKQSFYTRPAIRTLDRILQSDAYAVEPYHAKQTKNMSGEKERLQKAMASRSSGNVIVGGGSAPELDASRAAPRSRIREEKEEELDEVQMLLEEIAERKAWLEDLEALGQGAKYRRDVNQEIELCGRRAAVVRPKWDLGAG
ncbi:MAG: hypothetical protein BJ554DRAFT_7133 [Olpidium bornovanus]|uniref:Uncharacterized protein n=1 Tax=Olpidium bornovanus TaxID=278681 RepID=A0A8H8DK51_9FUNG|nr:MAG: hypothetical protein BJ554DRAFT_7133 [Olpidium bornovanus]